MEVFILDPLLRPIDVVDTFVSSIWTERYSEIGDFELVTRATDGNRRRFVEDTILSITESKRLMVVEKVEDKEDEENGNVLKITGSEVSSVFEKRILLNKDVDTGVIYPKWLGYLLLPVNIVRNMVWEVVVDGQVSDHDILPFLEWSTTLYPPGTIPAPTVEVSWEQEPVSLYEAIKNVLDPYDLGFRLYKDPDQSKMYFDVYTGSDRTTQQTELAPVVFAPDLENIQNTTELRDTTDEFNVVYVLYIHKPTVPEGDPEPTHDVVDSVWVVDPNADISAEGFTRKVKLIKITSVPDDLLEAEIPDYLTQLGNEELQKSRPIGVFDGEIDNFSQYQYERDYFLGDIVEVRNKVGATAFMRVVEQIFTEDQEGQRSYPTLITKEFINPGTWLSWKYDIGWSEFGEDYWADQ